MKLWDTAGQERFRTLTLAFYKRMAACIIVYDCTDEKTFSNVKHWINSIKEHAPIDVVKIIVGNKCDLDS